MNERMARGPVPERWIAERYCVCGHHRDVHSGGESLCLARMCRCEALRLPVIQPTPMRRVAR